MKKLPQNLFFGILLSIILTQSALCQTAYLNQFQYSSINDLTLSRVTQVIGNSGLQVVAGGHKTPNEEQVTEPFIAQLNPNGTVQWFFNLIPQGYGANTNFYITSIIATVDGSGNPNGYLVSLFFDTAPWKSIFIHRTLSGGSDWQKVLDIGPNNMMPVTSVIQCSQTNNYSYAFTAFTGNPRVLVLGKLDVTGTSITLRKYGNSALSQEPPYVIKENAFNGNFVASYTAYDTAAGIRRLHLLELGSGLNVLQQSMFNINSSEDTYSSDLFVDASGSNDVTIAGYFKSGGIHYPFASRINLSNIQQQVWTVAVKARVYWAQSYWFYHPVKIGYNTNSDEFSLGFHEALTTTNSSFTTNKFSMFRLQNNGTYLNANSNTFTFSGINNVMQMHDFTLNDDNTATQVRGLGYILKTNDQLFPPSTCIYNSTPLNPGYPTLDNTSQQFLTSTPLSYVFNPLTISTTCATNNCIEANQICFECNLNPMFDYCKVNIDNTSYHILVTGMPGSFATQHWEVIDNTDGITYVDPAWDASNNPTFTYPCCSSFGNGIFDATHDYTIRRTVEGCDDTRCYSESLPANVPCGKKGKNKNNHFSVDRPANKTVADNILSSNAKVYPNPSKGIFKIQSKEKIKSITVLDGNGKKIKELESINNKYVSLNLSGIPAGIYLLETTCDTFSEQQKLIISK